MNPIQNDFVCSTPYTELDAQLEVTYVDKVPFLMDQSGFVQVFTDGSCLKNGQTAATAGIGVYFGPNHVANASKPFPGQQSNNRAELLAVYEAIDKAFHYKIQKLCVNTDSIYVIKSLTEWRHKWKVNEWKTARGQTIAHKNEFDALDKLFHTVSPMVRCYRYVPGHSYVHGNIQADNLAKAAASQEKLHDRPITFQLH